MRVPENLTQEIATHVKQSRNELYRRTHLIPYQKPRIEEFVGRDEFALVILDACRYDAFAAKYADFFKGKLSKTWSSGRWTAEYIQRSWDGYHDLTYITAAPVVSKLYFNTRKNGQNPESYFKDIIPLWDTHWDSDLRTTLAEDVTNVALSVAANSKQTRLVAHYIQPHYPYIGTIRPEGMPDEIPMVRDRVSGDVNHAKKRWMDAIETGDISRQELRQAYAANLEYALREVQRLVQALDCPVVVTSDHGENLGEDGRYFHQSSNRYTRTVPWLQVESTVGDSEEGFPDDVQYDVDKGQSIDEDVINERLSDLGYRG